MTWTSYNATHVEQWQIVDLPKLADFWTEELDVRNDPQQEVLIGDNLVQRVRIRRVALFPLRSGTLTVGSLGIEAVVLRRIDTGFGLFEGSNFDLTRRSAPLTIEVHPLPPGPPVDAVGDVALTCGKPQQRGGGPVTMIVTMRGRANLRAALPPHWERAVDGNVQIGERPLTVERTHEMASMTRTWSYTIFPEHAGRFTIPPRRDASSARRARDSAHPAYRPRPARGSQPDARPHSRGGSRSGPCAAGVAWHRAAHADV